MWRPKDWERIKHRHITNTKDSHPMDKMFEAGADAMLEALKDGKYTTKVKKGQIADSLIGSRFNDDFLVVFIPEEENNE